MSRSSAHWTGAVRRNPHSNRTDREEPQMGTDDVSIADPRDNWPFDLATLVEEGA